MEKAKEILEKQLQLLYELSHEKELPVSDIRLLTGAMCEFARQLKNQSDDAQGWLASVQLTAKDLAGICVGQYERTRRRQKADHKKLEYLEKIFNLREYDAVRTDNEICARNVSIRNFALQFLKFRGKTSDGQTFYSDLIHLELRHYSVFSSKPKFEIAPSINGELVKEFVQLCGVDKNGHEVYEGDILLDELEEEHIAEIYMSPEFIARLILKE